MTESVWFAVVTAVNHYRCIPCGLYCDCKMHLSWAAPIHGKRLPQVSSASWDPI